MLGVAISIRGIVFSSYHLIILKTEEHIKEIQRAREDIKKGEYLTLKEEKKVET